MAVIFIKNMVCNRCIKEIRQQLDDLGMKVSKIELGKVVLEQTPTEEQLNKLKSSLKTEGFELLGDRQQQLIEQIKTLVINQIHYEQDKPAFQNFSDFIARQTGMSYAYLSKLFSSTEGITIEQFIIRQKIEKAKELLIYDELTLSEIAWKLDYSSVQHLSSQFKKVTGLTPSHFKKLKEQKRNPLDHL